METNFCRKYIPPKLNVTFFLKSKFDFFLTPRVKIHITDMMSTMEEATQIKIQLAIIFYHCLQQESVIQFFEIKACVILQLGQFSTVENYSVDVSSWPVIGQMSCHSN